MNDLIFIAMLCTSGLINLSSFDDALIDLLAFGIARVSLATRRAVLPEVPTVGVFVANWHEEDVLARMAEVTLLGSQYRPCGSISASIQTTRGTATWQWRSPRNTRNVSA